jgi:SnoaL-like domain
MNEIERLTAIEQIKQVKARYFRGVDSCDGGLVRALLAEDCVLDCRGCCTDPTTERDFIPAMNVILRGRDSWRSDGMSRFGIVSVHQGHNVEIEFTSDTTAKVVWSMTDRLYFPPGSDFAVMTGYGHYHETYVKIGQQWQIQTMRFTRIRVEAS